MGGYSARYHAASLAAVFLALAIGILIGVGFGDDVVSGTTEDLEESLQNDVERARDRTDELSRELNRERAFGEAVYPALVGGDLRGERVGLVALGALSDEIADEVDAAIEPAGAKLAQVAVVREPPDLAALADELRDTPYSRLRRDPDDLFDFAQAAGRGLVRGDGIVRRVRAQLLSRFSGRARAVDAVVVTRDAPQDLEPDDADANETFEDGLLDGIADAGRPLVGVERTDAERSSIELFSSHDISTVDDVDLVAGQVALISVLLGAEGSFGVKDTADELLPDLIRPAVGSR
ncbi:MAG TPA: copper transporter [Solirubrobacterales bacterium]|nr:copper transporter [Solirubrobacterales bacterium]